MNKFKRCLYLIFLSCIVFTFLTKAYAVNTTKVSGLEVLKEIEIPESFNFSINDTCSEHDFFTQATVQTDGTFAVHTFGIVAGDKIRSDFDSHFIDIYDAEGNFLKEISFQSKNDVAIELVDSILNIYLYSSVICYDLKTEDVHYYLVGDNAAWESGVVERVRAEKFQVGNWTYYYKDCFEGYTQLLRTDGEIVQTVLERTGRDKTYLIPGILFGVVGFLGGTASLIWYHKKKGTIREDDYQETIL